MKKKVNNLSAEQYKEGIDLSINNAKHLYEAGALLMNKGLMGVANSIFILSCEESIKAFAIFNKFLVDDDRDLSIIFESHSKKLSLLKHGYLNLSSESNAMTKSFNIAIKEMPNGTIEEIEKIARARKDDLYKDILDSINNKQRKEDEIFWNNANKKKQAGFYVGFTKNNWTSPSNITEKETRESAVRAQLMLIHVLMYKKVDVNYYKTINGYDRMSKSNRFWSLINFFRKIFSKKIK